MSCVVVNLHAASDGPNLRAVIDSTTFCGTDLTFIDNREFLQAKQNIIKHMLDTLNGRFSDFSDAQSVVKATRIADLAAWPRDWKTLKGFHSCWRSVQLDLYLYFFMLSYIFKFIVE